MAKLEAAALSPNAQASKRMLIRRAYLDVIGLPPRVNEIQAFLCDESPDAFSKVVDGLLDSEHYGERWARHWMDVAHYAETHGHDEDAIREMTEKTRYVSMKYFFTHAATVI